MVYVDLQTFGPITPDVGHPVPWMGKVLLFSDVLGDGLEKRDVGRGENSLKPNSSFCKSLGQDGFTCSCSSSV